MKEGDIVCWQYWDTDKGGCYSSIYTIKESILNYFPTLTPLAFWRIKKLKQ